MSDHGAGLVGDQLELLTAAQRLRGQFGGHAPGQGGQVESLRGGRVVGAFDAGQRQQLLDKVGGAVAAGQRGGQGALAIGVERGGLRHLRLHADGGDGCAQFVRGIGGEAALGLDELGDARKEFVQRLDQRRQLARGVGQRQGLQRTRLAREHRALQSAQGEQAGAHGQPHGQRQQRQGQGQRGELAAQHGVQDRGARVEPLAHPHLHVGRAARRGEHAPGGAVDLHGAEAARVGRQRLRRGVARAGQQLAVVPHLKGHARRVAVQGGGEGVVAGVVVGVVIAVACRVPGAALLADDERGRLGEVAVEQFVEFVLRADPRPGGGQQPHGQRHAQHADQQAALQRGLHAVASVAMA